MSRKNRWFVLFLNGAWLALGCGAPDSVMELQHGEGARTAALQVAAKTHGVRLDVLLGHAYQVGRFEAPDPAAHPGEQSGHAFEARHGLMHLSEAQVVLAAELTGLTADAIRTDLGANTEAAAALIRAYAEEKEGKGAQLSWPSYQHALAKLAGLTDADLGDEYSRDLLRLLGDGLDVVLEDGERMQLAPVTDLPELLGEGHAQLEQGLTAPGQYPPMRWVAAHPNNYVIGRGGGSVKYVVVHMTEGYYHGTLQWFSVANPYRSSTQYVIKSSDGQITQMVNEANTSWHAGNDYYSANSIGIEHEGFVSNLSYWFSEAMYQSSAKLVCAIARRYKIPVDRQHIIGHYQVPNPYKISGTSAPATQWAFDSNPWRYGGGSNHFDPSYRTTAWKWDYYLGLIKSCVDASNGASTTAPQNPITCSGAVCWPGNDLKEGDSGARVYSLQTALVHLGHLNAATALSGAGTFGPATKAAVTSLQKASGVPQTGYYGAQTAPALGAALKQKQPALPTQNLWVGSSGPAVSVLQQRLAALGYDLPATGYFGEITRAALLKFQLAHKVPGADGSFGPLTRMALAAHASAGF